VVEMTCPTDGNPNNARTSEVSSLTPSWTDGRCPSTAKALLGGPITVYVMDIDFAVDDPISSFQYTFTAANFEAGGVVLAMPGNVGTLTLKLEPRL
jgi:hypothetical protein